MPKIPTYEQQTKVSVGMNTPQMRSAGNLGTGIQVLGKGLEDVASAAEIINEAEGRRETAQAAAELSKLREKYTLGLDEEIKNAKVGDAEFAKNYFSKYEEEAGTIRDNLKTTQAQEYFLKASASQHMDMRIDFAHKQAAKLGEDTKLNVGSMLASESMTLGIDPDGLRTSVNKYHDLIDSQKIPNKAAAELLKREGSEKLAFAAALGVARANPDQALEKLKFGDYDQYFAGENAAQKKNQLEGEIKSIKTARLVDESRLREEQKRVKKEEDDKIEGQWLSKLVANKLTAKEIVDSNVNPDSKRTMLNMLKERIDSGGKIHTDYGLARELLDRIYLPNTDPKKIFDFSEIIKYAGKLDNDNMSFLQKHLEENKTQEGQASFAMRKSLFEVAKAKLVKQALGGFPDPDGEALYSKFQEYFFSEFEKQRKAGKSDLQLLSPSSPDYLGKALDTTFARTIQDKVNSTMKAFGIQKTKPVVIPADSPANKNNRTPEDWKKYLETKRGAK